MVQQIATVGKWLGYFMKKVFFFKFTDKIKTSRSLLSSNLPTGLKWEIMHAQFALISDKPCL